MRQSAGNPKALGEAVEKLEREQRMRRMNEEHSSGRDGGEESTCKGYFPGAFQVGEGSGDDMAEDVGEGEVEEQSGEIILSRWRTGEECERCAGFRDKDNNPRTVARWS
jgi:hypothetical protein